MASAKSNIPLDEARALLGRLGPELGLIVEDKASFIKVEASSTKHRIYVQKSAKLGRIDTTLAVLGEPGTYQISQDNGSIKCHIEPTLEHLETYLRKLVDPGTEAQVTNKPRPFAVAKPPAPRRPTPVQPPLPAQAPQAKGSSGGAKHPDLQKRLDYIRQQSINARIRLYVEEHGLDQATAKIVATGGMTLDEAKSTHKATEQTDLNEVLAETGVEVE